MLRFSPSATIEGPFSKIDALDDGCFTSQSMFFEGRKKEPLDVVLRMRSCLETDITRVEDLNY